MCEGIGSSSQICHLENKTVTLEEARQAQLILQRFEAAQVLGGGAPSGSVGYGSGSMHDGSKRLRECEDWEAVTYECSQPKNEEQTHEMGQQPISPSDEKKTVQEPLPPGITSLRDWGLTICRLPKVANLDLTYDELVSQPGRTSYLMWIKNHGIGQGSFRRLCTILESLDHMCKDPKSCYPGTSELREKKSA